MRSIPNLSFLSLVRRSNLSLISIQRLIVLPMRGRTVFLMMSGSPVSSLSLVRRTTPAVIPNGRAVRLTNVGGGPLSSWGPCCCCPPLSLVRRAVADVIPTHVALVLPMRGRTVVGLIPGPVVFSLSLVG